MKRREESGQATVELALALPLVVAFMLMVVQVGIIVRDQVAVVHANREAVRAASLSPDEGAPRRAALKSGVLIEERLVVERGARGAPGSFVTVTIRYSAPTAVPIIGLFLGDVVLESSATMRVEGDTG